MFEGGDGVLGVIGSIPPPPNTASWVDAKELDFGLIWPQHFHPVLLWIIGKLQTGLYMCFLEQGSLQALRDFSPSWRSVTNCFLGDYGPSCLKIIDKILPCSPGLIPHRSHDHWNSTRWDLAWSPRPREIDSYFVFLPFTSISKYLFDSLKCKSIYNFFEMRFSGFFCCCSVSHCSNKPTIKIIYGTFLCQ